MRHSKKDTIKRVLVMLTCIALVLLLVCCNHKPDGNTHIVPDQPTLVSISFVIPDLYTFETPEPVQVTAGEAGGELAFPEGAVALDMYDDLHWYYDDQWTNAYDPTAVVEGDMTLYLGESGKIYTVTFEKSDNLTYEGEFIDSYTYGGTRYDLPKVIGEGYPNGWYCQEVDAIWRSIPPLTTGDIVLRSPDPIQYTIYYQLGIEGGDETQFVNPNRTYCTVQDRVVTLADASYAGRIFDHWVILFGSGARTKQLGDVTYTDGDAIEQVTYEMLTSGALGDFYIVAVWQD